MFLKGEGKGIGQEEGRCQAELGETKLPNVDNPVSGDREAGAFQTDVKNVKVMEVVASP